MAEYLVRPATLGDADAAAADLRAADRVELEALGIVDPRQAIASSITNSRRAWTTTTEGRVLCVGGVAPLRPHLLFETIGVPWMLGVDELFAHRRPLIAMPPTYIRQMLALFPTLVNYVHQDNHQSIRWLRRLGFTVHPASPYGPHRKPFHRFTKHV